MKNNLKVWQYFCWIIAAISILFAVASFPKTKELTNIEDQIGITKQEIKQAKIDQQNIPTQTKPKTLNITKAEQAAVDRLSNSLEMALGGFKDSDEFQSKRDSLNKILSKRLTSTLYKMNGNADDAYAAKDTDKFEFQLKGRGTANVGFSDVTDPTHAQATAIVRFKPKYLKYGVIKIIKFDYDLTKQETNSAKLVNLQNPQLDGYFVTDD